MLLNRINKFKNIMGKWYNEDFKEYLRIEGFFNAPASTKYHGAFEGGLFEHSLAVTEKLLSMTEELNLKWEYERSPIIVGMFHDLCKIDLYKKIVDVEGVTMFGEEIPTGEKYHFEHRNDSLFSGRGDKSVMMLASWMHLTEEEILCIRYHMGAFDKDSWDYYNRAIEKYETVLWTHAADMYASKVLGV